MSRALSLISLLALASALAPATRAQDAPWTLHAVEHARSEGLPARRLLRGADPSERVEMSWMFFVARRGPRVVLIDVGTDLFTEPRGAGHRRSWRVRRAEPVTEALGRLSLRPSDVTDVVLTHHHWDHVGALGRYPRATVHAHPGEWRRLPERLRVPVERDGRLRARREDGALWPGFSVRVAGAHTRHAWMIELRCASGPLIVASDAAYLYRNVEEPRAIAVSASPTRNLEALRDAADRVGAERVIPGHDPAVFARHPSPAEGVATICP